MFSLSEPVSQGHDSIENPSRRYVLISAGMVATAASLLPWAKMAYAQLPAQASPAELAQFLSLSELLTCRKSLPADVSARLYASLAAGDQTFAARHTSLVKSLADAGIDDMSKFKNSAVDQNPALKALVMQIVSGWYLGYSGTPGPEAAIDNVSFITYTGALMYQPTRDVTVIPTYARGATNYWSQPPASITHD